MPEQKTQDKASQDKVPQGEIVSILNAYPKDRRYALAVMQDMQRAFNYIPKEGLEALAEYLECPIAGLFSMATFYKAISLKPKGRNIIKVCDGTPCHLRGSMNLVNSITSLLGIGPDETTTDGEFSQELVNCVGSCALAPVMIIGENYYGKVTLEELPKILESVREGEELPKILEPVREGEEL